MSTLTKEQSHPPGRSIFRWFANGMITFGILAMAVAIYNGVRDANLYRSPFDMVVGPDGDDEKGFLPLVIDADAEETGVTHAPTLSVSAAEGGIDEAKLAEVRAALAPQKDGTTGEENGEVLIPDRIVIPSLNLDAPILLADYKEIPYWGKTYKQWLAPNQKAVGWHFDSATLGRVGNTVLNGHHNIYGEVFRRLGEITPGSIIYLYAGEQAFSYIVVTVEILPEKFQEVEVRLANAQWTAPSDDERVTLVTCWPYEGNSHRVVVVAAPITLDGPAP